VDRIKDLILCSGYNVYPRVIEEAIYQHAAVAETIVIAVPDDYRGQAPKAFMKLKDGHSLTGEELKKFLKEHLSPIEMPRDFEFRDELPKTMVGKLSKKELVEEEAAKRAATLAKSA
ncbi:long-chain fatty acid--CoA ligase, partial [Roseibium sp. RKSG952]|nr:long-chain fatty acid--CoA ligase [Roseibium sp. RKSG952]